MRVPELVYFIKERHNIYELRKRNRPKPWTDDPILQNYRFCNVYRELDKETLWVATNWRYPNEKDPDVWFAMLVARVVNWHPTLAQLGYPVPWNRSEFMRVLNLRTSRGEKVWTGAYMITTHKHPMPKIAYYAKRVLDPAWQRRAELRPRKGDTLSSFHARLMTVYGISSFLAAQVVADTKYTKPLLDAADWLDWAAPGSGSLRGLNRIMNRDIKHRFGEGEWLKRLRELQLEVNEELIGAGMAPLHAQDLQNCLCEFDKYERVRLGEGRPRSRYNGNGE